MAISAKRFSFLDKETNVASSSFTSKLDSGILTDPANMLQQVNQEAQSLLGNITQQQIDVKTKVGSVFESATREVKTFAGKLVDLGSLTDVSLNSFVNDITGTDATVSKSLQNLIKKCSTKGSGYGIPGKPYDASINCGSGKMSVGTGSSSARGRSGCDAGSLTNLLSRLTGGDYNNAYKDVNKLLQQLMSLSGMGYNLGLCGVFSAVSSGLGLDKTALSKASGALLGSLGLSQNTNAVLDLAKSAVGLTPLLFNPTAITTFVDNFKNPSNVGETRVLETSERVLGGMELLSPSWMRSGSDGRLSTAVATKVNPQFKTLAKTANTNRAFGASQINTIPNQDLDFVLGAFSARA